MKPNPYNLTFSDYADAGPVYLLYLLKDHSVCFKKAGETVVQAMIVGVDENKGTVTLLEFNPVSGLHDGDELTLNVYEDFDEVMYL